MIVCIVDNIQESLANVIQHEALMLFTQFPEGKSEVSASSLLIQYSMTLCMTVFVFRHVFNVNC